MLTHQELLQRIEYNPATGIIYWRANNKRAGTIVLCGGSKGYRRIVIGQKQYSEHCIIWFYMTGEWPRLQIDHANMVRDDNRWANLREATHTDNIRNRHVNPLSRTGLKGISFAPKQQKKWRARYKLNGKDIYIGSFSTPEEAHAAYARAAESVFGKFARIN